MDVAPSKKYRLKQEGPGNFEEENAWLKEWIHEELAHGEVWQKQYESLLEHQAQLYALLQTKSLKPLEKKTQTLQEELEEIQETLRECQNRSRQRQLHIHKQEKENQRMAETVKELEKKVFKQQLEEKSNKNILKELRTEGNELKRHLSEWEAKWHTKNDRIRQKQNQIEKLSNTIQALSLRSQELHRNINILEDSVAEAQQEIMLSQKEAQSGTSAEGLLWEERACDQMKRLPCLELSSFKKEFPSLQQSAQMCVSSFCTCVEACCCLCTHLLFGAIMAVPSGGFFLHPTIWDAWNLLWILAKFLFLLLLLILVFHFFHGWFSDQPCPQDHSAPVFYIQPKNLLLPLAS